MKPDLPALGLDPVASTDRLALHIHNPKVPVVILSRREIERLHHQLGRWLNWDRERQGTPRMWHMTAKDVCHITGAVRKPKP